MSHASILRCAALSLVLAAVSCQDKVAEPEPPPKPTTSAATVPDPTELKIEDLTVGEGDRAVKEGDEVKVLYVGRLLKTNAKFDSNDKRDAPFKFKVGEGVIEGWSKGVVGMKKGGKRKLIIPSSLAYKEKGSPPKIPPNAPLTFEIELLGWADEKDAAPTGSASGGASASAAPAASAGPAASATAGPKKDDAKK